MKRAMCLISAIGFVTLLFAQDPVVEIATNETTSLIFSFPVIHVDRGNKDVLVEQVKEAQNILLVKAAAKNFSHTNLSVVTSDGSVYSLSVIYCDAPRTFIITPPRTK